MQDDTPDKPTAFGRVFGDVLVRHTATVRTDGDRVMTDSEDTQAQWAKLKGAGNWSPSLGSRRPRKDV